MAVGLKQSLNLSQTLRMTPQLQQAIKLLQLSRMELDTAIRKELEENPILEESPELTQEEPGGTADPGPAGSENEMAADQDPQRHDEFDWEAYIESSYKPSSSSMAGGNEEIMNYENVISASETLYDHLMWQTGMSGFSEEEQMLAGILISYIDDDGYIKVPLEQIAADEHVSAEDLESVLPYVQEFDPPGVGARDLQECLLVQAKHLQEDTKDLVHLIKNHLKDLEKKNYDGIAKAMGLEMADVVEMCKII
jgi:RNA polymerase sigma-54 factor